MTRVVIVGASVGGARTAQSLRAEGFTGQITLIGEEPEPPYDRPPLSKEVLATGAPPRYLLTQPEADTAQISLLLGRRATRLDLERRVVEMEGGEAVPFDVLVLATGSHPRIPPWGRVPGVHILRKLVDAQQLRESLLTGGPVAIVGAGFIGAEVASSARSLGSDVTLIDPLPVPMSRTFTTQVGEWFTDLHRRHGVRTLFGVGVDGIERDGDQLRVRLTNGTDVEAPTVVLGVGAIPAVQWLRSSGLTVDDGVLCDRFCRAVGTDHVFAVGDIARWIHQGAGRHIRAEHWTNAVEQAAAVAHNIARPTDPRPYTPTPYIWTDQYDWKIQVVGDVGSHLRPVVIGDPLVDGRSVALYAGDDTAPAGAVVVNWPRGLLECRTGLAAHRPLDAIQARLTAQLGDRAPSPISDMRI